jgi:elongation factor P
VSVEPPAHVDLGVTETEPGLKGDTATGGSKPATLETGIVVQVPLFVSVGDRVQVDTRTNEYLTRV